MRSAIVENGIVVNVIVGEQDDAIPCDPNVSPGWLYDGSTFTAPPVNPSPPLPPTPIDRVDNRRFKALLRQKDLFDLVDAAVRDNASPEAIIAWDAGAPISRESPAVNQIADMLGLDLDDLITGASKLTL